MDYFKLFKEKKVVDNPLYSRDDIGVAQLFYDAHAGVIRYIVEANTWYAYNGKRWTKDERGLQAMELCKSFVKALAKYARTECKDEEEFADYANKLKNRRRRESILSDAKSIAPMKLSEFDTDKFLLNCRNGTYNLKTFAFQPHRAADYITKIANVDYDPKARCQRWEGFIDEIMLSDSATAAFLQKSLGYVLTGDTSRECLFILIGPSTRNGKSTLMESVAHILSDYAQKIQPQTLSRRFGDGAAPSPDIARLKGARLVDASEPPKDMELNVAMIKQLTGGDTYTGRFLNENPIQYRPEFKLFMHTNYLPQVSDDTLFTSGRVMLIPFDRHFLPEEQEEGLKEFFKESANTSGILNWLIEGYRLLCKEELAIPARVQAEIEKYRLQKDNIGSFFAEVLTPQEGNRIATSEVYTAYKDWTELKVYKSIANRSFTMELKRRGYDIRADGKVSNVLVGYAFKE